MKALAAYIVKGRQQAVLVATACGVLTFIVPLLGGLLNYLAATTIALVTLHVGILPGLQVMAIAATLTLLFYQLLGVQAIVALVMVLLLWLPCWLSAAVLQKTRRLGDAVKVAALVGVCLLVLVFAFFGDPVPWWLAQLKIVAAAIEEAGAVFPSLSDEEMMQGVAALLTGVVIASLVMGTLGSVLLARWWQSVLVRPGAFRDEFYDLRLGTMAGLVTLGIMLATRVTDGVISDFCAQLAMVLLVAYLLVGLAIIHRLLQHSGRARVWLALVYVLLTIIPQVTLLLAAGGLLDTWIDFRQRLNRGAGDTRQ